MAKASTYIKDIRAQVRADHGGKVPDHLNLTIRNYANALEMRDTLLPEKPNLSPTLRNNTVSK